MKKTEWKIYGNLKDLSFTAERHPEQIFAVPPGIV
jgi:hypothetical protein